MGSVDTEQHVALWQTLKVDADRANSTLQESCQWGSTPDGGMNRLTANDDDGKVRRWFIEETKKYGCSHKIDAMGNIFAIRPGQNNTLAPIAIGSHLDTQPTGGRYDGIVGVLSGIEVLKTLHDANITSYAPLCIVDWTNEEGARFPPAMLASGVWGGAFTLEYAQSRTDLHDPTTTIKSELERIGFLGSTECSFEANPLLAHFEIHIEQAVELDIAQEAVAVVRGVQSMRWYSLNITGQEAHTGSTAMNRRRDALLGAAKMIVKCNEISTTDASMKKGNRMTIAVINSSPGSINTISGHVQLNLDIRSPMDHDVEELERTCREAFSEIAKADGLGLTFEKIWESPAVLFDDKMVECVRAAATEQGCKMELTSGAGHDSVYTSKKVPTAMIFVRCRDGISHNPAEYSRPEDIATGAQVLLGAYLRYDAYIRQQHEKKRA